VPKLRMNGAIPLLPLHAFMVRTGTTLLFTHDKMCVNGKILILFIRVYTAQMENPYENIQGVLKALLISVFVSI
jgi:hypothetical protein